MKRKNIKKWLKNFHNTMEKLFQKKLQDEKISGEFFHQLHLLHLFATLPSRHSRKNSQIHSHKVTHVINLTNLSAKEILRSKIQFTAGGCGLVFALKYETKHLLSGISSYPVEPKPEDKHGGRTWEEWFSLTASTSQNVSP